MANPHDVEWTVPQGYPRVEFPAGSCNYFYAGDVITMSEAERSTCQKLLQPEPLKDKCFPEYCLTQDGWPTDGYRVQVRIPANSTVIHPVPSEEGCRPPNKVSFHTCGMCIYADYDKTPLIDPDSAIVATGGGADPSPTIRDLVTKGVCVETIHMLNPSDSEVLVTLSYFC